MTKEEIIEKHLGRYLLKLSDITHGTDVVQVCLERSMEEYARQEAIDFSSWNCKNLWSTYGDMWIPYQDEDNPISGEELYNLYFESKLK